MGNSTANSLFYILQNPGTAWALGALPAVAALQAM
jgi:hypothetical protein